MSRRTRASRRTVASATPATPLPRPTPRWLEPFDLAAFATTAALVAWVFSTRLAVQFTLPKLFWLHATLPILIIAWAIRFARGRTRPIPRAILGCSVALVIWWTITTATAVDRHTALYGAYGRYNGLFTHLACMVLFWMMASSGLDRRAIEMRARVIVLVFVPVAAYAVVQYLGWDALVWPNPRSASTIGQPVPLAALLGLCVPFALTFVIVARGPSRLVWAMVLALLVASVATTLSRGPAIGAGIAAGIVTVAALGERGVRLGALGGAGAAICTAAVAILMLSAGGWGELLVRVRPLSDSSFTNRFGFYRVATAMAADRPLFGSGFDSYGLLYRRYFTPSAGSLGADVVPTMVHNGYLHTVVTNGLPGLVFYLGLAAALLVSGWQAYRGVTGLRARLMCAAFVAAIAGFLVQDLTGWLEVPLSVFFWITCGLAVAYGVAETHQVVPAVRTSRVRMIIAGAVAASALAAGAGLSVRTARLIEADALVFAAPNADLVHDWPSVAASLDRALARAPDEAHYWVAAARLYLKRVDIASDRQAYDTAARALAIAHRLGPHDPYALIHRLDLDVAAIRRGLIGAASPDAEQAIQILDELDRNHPAGPLSTARLRLAERRPEQARQALARARTIEPERPGLDGLDGDIHREAGDRLGAILAYRRAVARLQSDQPDWLINQQKLILNLLESGRRQEALQEAAVVLAVHPHDAVTHEMVRVARQ